jgi:hypothetical protein
MMLQQLLLRDSAQDVFKEDRNTYKLSLQICGPHCMEILTVTDGNIDLPLIHPPAATGHGD